MGNERDGALLGRHLEIAKDNYLLISAWIESHPGIKFSLVEVSEATGLCFYACVGILRTHPLVGKIDDEMFKKRGPQKKYISLAPPLIPTAEGLKEEIEIRTKQFDELGRGAREEYYRSIETASLSIPHRFRIKKG